MRTVDRKFFPVWQVEKEEAWLNEKAEQGKTLIDAGFCRYTFEDTAPGEYIIRLEKHGKDPDYVAFMEETGAEYLGGMIGWMYFRRKSSLGAFDIFSDIDSRIRQLDAIGKTVLGGGSLNLVVGIINSVNGTNFGWINLLCCAVLAYALGRIHGKKEALEKERSLHE